MIRHIVLVRFRDEIDEPQIEALFAEIESLQPRLPGMLRVVSGRSLELERLEKGFRHGFIVEFDGPAALEAYQANEDHRRMGAKLVAAAEGGLDGILVFDLPS
ncbi:Dabb family protein [Microvirga yunnanensis]|uniref:Dabb family protein n=1 Tax=Microvirga yunnanensis TaxID=2953740 RepID=UPI0021C9E653|nr:Dabb family protein [Microvirga sp. HBU65207]